MLYLLLTQTKNSIFVRTFSYIYVTGKWLNAKLCTNYGNGDYLSVIDERLIVTQIPPF